MRRRIVIAPFGLPNASQGGERCAELLVKCGADLSRTFEGNPQSPASFENHLAAIRDIREGGLPVFVVICGVIPVERVIETRRTLEARLPSLEKAAWVLFADLGTEPGCLEALVERGELDGPALDAPEWITNDGRRYLLLVSKLNLHVELDLTDRVRRLTRPLSAPSGRMLRDTPADPPNPNENKPQQAPTLRDLRALKAG